MLVFLGGALLGGAAALLFAPKCGADLRSSIKDMIEKEVDAIRCHCEELKEHVH
jgi:gas vesicle protein